MGAQDPYCGWDVVMKKCTSLEESLSMTQWEQSISACPVRATTLTLGHVWGVCHCPDLGDGSGGAGLGSGHT